jgi:hypothetical protein
MSNIESDFFKDSKLFSKSLGELLHSYAGDGGITFQRDMQVFLYGRYCILNKNLQIHEDRGFGIDEAAYHLGSSFASFIENISQNSKEMGQELSKDDIARISEIFEKEIIKGFRDKKKMLENDPDDTLGYPQTLQ